MRPELTSVSLDTKPICFILPDWLHSYLGDRVRWRSTSGRMVTVETIGHNGAKRRINSASSVLFQPGAGARGDAVRRATVAGTRSGRSARAPAHLRRQSVRLENAQGRTRPSADCAAHHSAQ